MSSLKSMDETFLEHDDEIRSLKRKNAALRREVKTLKTEMKSVQHETASLWSAIRRIDSGGVGNLGP